MPVSRVKRSCRPRFDDFQAGHAVVVRYPATCRLIFQNYLPVRLPCPWQTCRADTVSSLLADASGNCMLPTISSTSGLSGQLAC